MKEFFAILFFGKTVLLTPVPISFVDELQLTPDEPLTAVTSGASIRIDVSNAGPGLGIKEAGIPESRKVLEEKFPEGCVKAVLHGDRIEVVLDNRGVSLSNNGAWLTLSSEHGIPIKTNFSSVTVSSCSQLTDVTISWKNFMH